MDAVTQWGIELILTLQQWPALQAPMQLLTAVGTEEFFLLLMPILLWSIDARLGRRLAVVLIGSSALFGTLKLALQQPRPYWLDARVQAWSTETSYGPPSGHAMNAASVWGFLGRHAAQRIGWAAWVLALALIFLVGFSRMHLGVHSPVDVALGWLAGGLWLWAVVRWEAPVTRWLRRLGLARQVGLALVVAGLYAALNLALAAAPPPADLARWEAQAAAAAPPEPGQPAIDPRSPATPAASAGMLFGLGAGLACAARWARFDAGGRLPRRAARYLLGVAGVLLFWRGLALVFPTEPLALGLALRFVRYALVVYWALFLAPWLFLKLRLAVPEAADSRQAADDSRQRLAAGA